MNKNVIKNEDAGNTSSASFAKDTLATLSAFAFVWFATHFGGGFASGVQVYSYFINYGITCLFFPLISIAMIALVYYWGFRHARKYQKYDYRSFNDSFYGKFAPIFSNLYEFLYIVIVLISTSVAFATGASVLGTVTGMSYLVASLVVGVFIWIVCMFGTNVVRKTAGILSIIMIIMLLCLYIPSIALRWEDISAALSSMTAAAGTAEAPLWPAVKMMLLYGIFQSSNVGLFVQHTRNLKSYKSVGKAVLLGYVMNAGFMILAVLGLLSVALEENIASVSVPLLVVVESLPGGDALSIAVSILIILACVSTGVTFVSGLVNRLTVRVMGAEAVEKAEDTNRPLTCSIIASLAMCVICCCIAQFGLLSLIQQGYSIIGYLAIPVITIPYICNFIYVKVKGEKPAPDDCEAEVA